MTVRSEERRVSSFVTSIRFDIQEMGAIACRTLVDLIHAKPVNDKTLLGYNIILKSSTQSM